MYVLHCRMSHNCRRGQLLQRVRLLGSGGQSFASQRSQLSGREAQTGREGWGTRPVRLVLWACGCWKIIGYEGKMVPKAFQRIHRNCQLLHNCCKEAEEVKTEKFHVLQKILRRLLKRIKVFNAHAYVFIWLIIFPNYFGSWPFSRCSSLSHGGGWTTRPLETHFRNWKTWQQWDKPIKNCGTPRESFSFSRHKKSIFLKIPWKRMIVIMRLVQRSTPQMTNSFMSQGLTMNTQMNSRWDYDLHWCFYCQNYAASQMS